MSGEWSLIDRDRPRMPAPPGCRPERPPPASAGRCAPCDHYQSFYQEEPAFRLLCNQQMQPSSCQQFEGSYPLPQPLGAPFQFQQPLPLPLYSQSYFGPMPHSRMADLSQPQPQQEPPPPEILSPPPQILPQPQHQPQPQLLSPQTLLTCAGPLDQAVPRGENPREIRNKAEKQRRDKLNRSISELAGLVPPVVAASRKIDKTGVLRLTAHYLRAHQHVFGDTIGQAEPGITPDSASAFLRLLSGFLITVTYKGLVVVVSQNVHEYLGYTELDLLGQNIMTIVHEDDRRLLQEQMAPRSSQLGPSGELLVPDDPVAQQEFLDALGRDRKHFNIRFKKLTQRSEPAKYMMCHVEGSLRKADRACRGYTRCCQMVRRARARGDNPCSSGNDVVFIGMVRPTVETFITEREIDTFLMEYSTRHLVDGEIIQCEQKISLVTGYMTHEVNGVNAMNFMHRDDVRWVIIALREMYDERRLYGESCYRLITKNGQFIYMRTRGRLEVDPTSQAVTTFVCTNTVVNETDGKHLISLMKQRFMLVVNNNQEPIIEEDTSTNDSQKVSVEDPRQLEKVIMHLVTNLPSPDSGPDSPRSSTPDEGVPRLTIIPPRRERIVSSIEKIYKVFKNLDPREPKKPPQVEKRQTVLKICEPVLVSASVPLPSTFEETFLKDNDEISFVAKKSDQVLAAVQLEKGQQPRGEPARAPKRKLPPPAPPARPAGSGADKAAHDDLFEHNTSESLLDEGELDSQLDSALSLFSAIGAGSEAAGTFPDILMGTEFQELFGSMGSAGADVAEEPGAPGAPEAAD